MHKTRHLNRLLKRDRVFLGNAADLDVSLTLDSDAEGLVCKKPLVEGGEGLGVVDLKFLGDVDGLEFFGGGGREVDTGKWSVGLEILEVHVANEGVNIGLDLAVALDGAVDGHRHAAALGVCYRDAVEDELGLIKLVLSHFGNGNEKTTEHWSERGA